MSDLLELRRPWEVARYDPSSRRGHFESYFQRANHPTRPLAFWIRYTLFSPPKRPEAAEGELWAIWFDGENNVVTNDYRAVPMQDCSFSRETLAVRVGEATLDARSLQGATGKLAWRLQFQGDGTPVPLYPLSYYKMAFPKSKIACPTPNARFTGSVKVEGNEHAIADWPGSQTHVWSPAMGELYAWGQVCSFQGTENAFLELTTARLKIGPFQTPNISGAVLRYEGKDYRLNTPMVSLRAKGRFADYHWRMSLRGKDTAADIEISAPRARFARLQYRNPAGGFKTVLNSKIARCEVLLKRRGQADVTLLSEHGAAFELLGDESVLTGLGF